MAPNPKNLRAEQLAPAKGESLTDVVISALEAQLKVLNRVDPTQMQPDVAQIQDFLASQPTRDTRSAEEILGYDAFGLPARARHPLS